MISKEEADTAFDKKEFGRALQLYRRILRSPAGLSSDEQLSVIRNMVECLYREGEYAQVLGEIDGFDELFDAGSVCSGKLQALRSALHVDLGDYPAAIRSGEEAYGILRNTGENSAVAEVQETLGIAHLCIGELLTAKMSFEDALATRRRISDESGMLSTLNNLAQVCFASGQWSQATDYLEQGLRVSEASAKTEWTASLSLNAGMIYGTAGKWSEAEEYLRAGLSFSVDLGHTLDVVRGKISLAFLHRVRREWDEATSLLHDCREICEEEGFKRELCLSLEGLGEVAFDRGDFAECKKRYSAALKLAEGVAPEGDMAVEIQRRLGDLSVAVGRPKQAVKQINRALRLASKLGDKFETACCHRTLALASQALGDSEKTHSAFVEAVSLLEELGETYERAKTLLEFGKCLGTSNRGDEGIQQLVRARELFEKLPSKYWLARVELEIARIGLGKGSADLAVVSLDKATALLEELRDETTLAESLTLREAVERSMVEASLQENSLSIPDSDPQKLLKYLAKETNASKAFVAAPGQGIERIVARHNMEAGSARALLNLVEVQGLVDPYISTNHRYNSLVPAGLNGIRSFILIPFGSEREPGFLYLDGKNAFTQKDLTLSVRLADALALRLAQLRQRELKEENLELREQLKKRGYPEIVTRDKRMLDILNLVDKVTDQSTPVFISGETGTGKELVARAVHYGGARASKPFVALDCGTLPDTLAESELFGHKKGTFTDAKEDKPGLFELANKGTLFLDEVSNLSLRSQAKLLRVLQERKVRRLGGTRERKVDVRIIAASNSDLEEETRKGNFRQDLYHRLKVMEIELPPLRERRGDIPLLVQHFIEDNSVQRKQKVEGITADALRILNNFKWPGNVRQLKNEIERAIILTDDGWIAPNLFSKAVRKTKAKRTRTTYDIREIVRVLRDNGWVKRSAAKKLGIPESTLRRRLRVHGIVPPTRQ